MTEEGKNTQQDAKLTMEELEGVSGGGDVPGVDYNPFRYDDLVCHVMWGLAVTTGRDTTVEMLIEASQKTLLDFCKGTYPDPMMPRYVESHARQKYASLMNRFAYALGWVPWTTMK